MMDNLRKAHGNKCIICGKKKRLEFAHIKPTKLSGRGRGSKHRYLDIKKNKDCYVLVCKGCHALWLDNIPLKNQET